METKIYNRLRIERRLLTETNGRVFFFLLSVSLDGRVFNSRLRALDNHHVDYILL